MVRGLVKLLKNNYQEQLKLWLIFAIAVIVGALLPSVFSAETKEIIDEITDMLNACLGGTQDFCYVGFWHIFLFYGIILGLLWLVGFNRIAAVPSLAALLGFGVLLGISVNIVFSPGFAYGMMLLILSILPGNLLIAAALVLAVANIMQGSHSFSEYSYGFLLPLILVIVACWYMTWAGPLLLDFFISLI